MADPVFGLILLIAIPLMFVPGLLHDLVLLYTLTGRALQILLPGRAASASRGAGRINYVQVPALVSLLLLVVWYPLILCRVLGYQVTTGLAPGAFLGHWLLITAALFAASALCLLAAMARGNRQCRQRQTRARRG